MNIAARETSTVFHYDRERSPGVYIVPDMRAGFSPDQALRAGIAKMIRKARRYSRAQEGEGTHWTEGYAGRVIEWALSLKPEPSKMRSPSKLLNQGASDDAALLHDHPATVAPPAPASKELDASARMEESKGSADNSPQLETADPIVRSLLEAHRARKTWPAGHTFSMTNPTVNGQWVTLGTCTCGDNFSYPFGSAGHEKMDAAIEAHWQKFDATAEKIDGRGQPISSSDGSCPVPARDVGGTDANGPRKKGKATTGRSARRSPPTSNSGSLAPDIATSQREDRASPGPSETQPDAPEGIPASNIAEALAPAPLRSEPAPLSSPAGAGSTSFAVDDDDGALLRMAEALAWREPQPVSETLKALLDFSKVYATGRKVERPILRWHGSKWKIAPWVIGHFPPHQVYVEPFGGSAAVLLRKPNVGIEVYNDLDGDVVNLFRVLRERPDELAISLSLTPYAREEYAGAYATGAESLERARLLIARSFMGAHSKGAIEKSGFDTRINGNGSISGFDSLRAVPDQIAAAATRLRDVVIENDDAFAVIKRYDRADCLIYADPPYVPEQRSTPSRYANELDADGHGKLLGVLQEFRGLVALSGYPSQLYDRELAGWRRVEQDSLTDGNAKRTEVLWLNPACAAALDQQMPALFDLATMDVANTPPHGLSGG